MSGKDDELHLLLIGEHSTGKSAIMSSYGECKYSSEYQPSAYCHTAFSLMHNNKQIAVSVHEVGGKYFDLFKPHFLSIKADCLVCVTCYFDKATFSRGVSMVSEIVAGDRKTLPVFFVAAKCDLLTNGLLDERELNEVLLENRRQYRDTVGQMNSILYECSALTREGIKEMFDSIILTLLQVRGTKLQGLELPPTGIKVPSPFRLSSQKSSQATGATQTKQDGDKTKNQTDSLQADGDEASKVKKKSKSKDPSKDIPAPLPSKSPGPPQTAAPPQTLPPATKQPPGPSPTKAQPSPPPPATGKLPPPPPPPPTGGRLPPPPPPPPKKN